MAYLWLSTRWPTDPSLTAEEMVRYEFVKGSIFMCVAALGIFGLCYYFMSKLENQQTEIAKTREHLMEVQGRVLTGTLTASVAHDLRNLLAVIQPNLEFAADESLTDEERRASLQDAIIAAGGLSSLNERLTRVARQGTADEPKKVDLADLARGAIEMVKGHTKLNRRDIKVVARDAVPIRLLPDLAVHAIINMVLNAADATQSDGEIIIYVRRRTDCVELEVHDDGEGIPEDLRHSLLEPFHTTKKEGTGLGLFIVGHFARMHGGAVELDQSELGGALVRVTLPRDSEVSLTESDPIFLEGNTELDFGSIDTAEMSSPSAFK